MLQLTSGQSNEKIIVTLNELKTLDEPFYLFRFVHVGTGQVVSFVRFPAVDESLFQGRYNKYNVDTSIVFLDRPPGEWHYTVYEQISAINTDPDSASIRGVLEYGKMMLVPATELEPDLYDNGPRLYKMYQG